MEKQFTAEKDRPVWVASVDDDTLLWVQGRRRVARNYQYRLFRLDATTGERIDEILRLPESGSKLDFNADGSILAGTMYQTGYLWRIQNERRRNSIAAQAAKPAKDSR